MAAYAAIRGLQPGNAAIGGRNANGPSRIGAQRHRQKLAGDERCRASTRAAGYTRRIERIQHEAIMRVLRCDAESDLVKVGLADGNGARRAQPLHHRCIVIGNEIFKYQRSASGTNAAREEQIFKGNGDAVKRAAVIPGGKFPITFGGFGECLFLGQRDQAMEAVTLFNIREYLRDQFHARELAAAQLLP